MAFPKIHTPSVTTTEGIKRWRRCHGCEIPKGVLFPFDGRLLCLDCHPSAKSDDLIREVVEEPA